VTGIIRGNRKEAVFQAAMTAVFLAACAVCLTPVLNIVAVSFSAKPAILSGKVYLLPVGFNISAYKQVLSDGGFIFSFAYSIGLTLMYTALAMFLTVLCAYPLSKGGLRGRRVFMALIVVTMYFTPGVIPGYLNIKNLGLLDTVWSLALPGAISAYNVIIMRAFFSSVDTALYEAAFIDGASERRTLVSVAVPLSAPSIATLSLFYAVGRWNGVNDVIFYITNPRLYTVQLRLKQMMDSAAVGREEGTGAGLTAESVKAAGIIFSMTPMLVFYPFVQKYLTKGIMLGSVKG
jgi:putative aldouronate transport system permease protein